MEKKGTDTDDFLVDLSGALALVVGILAGGHLEHAHAEGVDVDALVVVLFVHLRRHELGRADHRFSERPVLQRGQAQVADLHAARRTRDEYVVALSIKQFHQPLIISFSIRIFIRLHHRSFLMKLNAFIIHY